MEYKAFKDLTKEERSEIVEAISQGCAEMYSQYTGWQETDRDSVDFYTVYRIKPAKKLNIPWEIIKPEYKWAAMDDNGKVCVFTTEPVTGYGYWHNPDKCGNFESITALNIDTTGISWENSLTQRPEGI